MSFADNPQWQACSRTLRSEGFNHTAGHNFARLREGKPGMDKARIVVDDDGRHTIKYV